MKLLQATEDYVKRFTLIIGLIAATVFVGSCRTHRTVEEEWRAAIESEDVNRIELLCKDGPAPIIRLTEGCDGSTWTTPIHVAAFGGKTKAMAAMLSLGMDPNASDSLGRTPYFSVINGPFTKERSECIEMLYSADADIDQPDTRAKWTPLHFAVIVEQPEYCRLLVARKAQIHVSDGTSRTPLDYAKASRPHVRDALVDALSVE